MKRNIGIMEYWNGGIDDEMLENWNVG